MKLSMRSKDGIGQRAQILPKNGFIRVRVKERIITVPGQAIGQGSGPRARVVTCGGGGNSLQTPPKKLLGAGVSKF